MKKITLITSLTLMGTILPQTIISCSSTTKSNEIDQNWIDTNYKKFYDSSLLINQDEIYLNYFIKDLNNSEKFDISFDVISQILNIDLLNGVKQIFEGKIIESNNEKELEIIYTLKNNDQELKPTNNNYKSKKIKIQTLNEEQNNQLKEIIDSWSEYKDIFIKNQKNNQKVDLNNKEEIKKINSTFLIGESNNKDNQFFKESLNNFIDLNKNNNFWNIDFDINFGLDGIIEINLIIKKNNVRLQLDSEKSKKTFEGFWNNKDNQEAIIKIFKQLGISYNLKTLMGNNDEGVYYPQFASSIYDFATFETLLKEMKKLPDKDNRFEIPEYFSEPDRSNLWYQLNIESINANDISGVLNVNFSIIDRFSGLIISPQNLSKIMTITNFSSLVIKKSNNVNEDDQSQLENVYQAYNLFNKIELNKDKQYINLASKDDISINIEWLIANTNIENLIEFNNKTNEGYEFVIKSPWINKPNNVSETMRSNTFRIKNDFIFNDKKNIINDDINGVKSIPFILEIKTDLKDGMGEQWYKVLPQEKNINSSTNAQFGTKTLERAYIKVGYYRTKDIDFAHEIYNELSKHKKINIIVSENVLQNLSNQNQKNGVKESKTLINKEIIDILSRSGNFDSKKINQIKNKFDFYFDLFEKAFNGEVDPQTNKLTKLFTDEIELIIIAKDNNDERFDNIDNSSIIDKPKITISFSN